MLLLPVAVIFSTADDLCWRLATTLRTLIDTPNVEIAASLVYRTAYEFM